VIDFERIPGTSPDWVLKHVRAGKEEFRREIEAAGFRYAERLKLMRENYVLRFTKRPIRETRAPPGPRPPAARR
jgi:hypothetical protein